MTLTPVMSPAPVAGLVLRLAALLFLTVHLGVFAQVIPTLRDIHLEGATDYSTAVMAAYLFPVAVCALIFFLTPALVAWSQLGASRTDDADARWDRWCRAIILVSALILVMPGLGEDARAAYNLLHYLSTHRFTEENLAQAWLHRGPLYPLTALIVILAAPALGAAHNAARRALKRASQPHAAASTGDPA